MMNIGSAWHHLKMQLASTELTPSLRERKTEDGTHVCCLTLIRYAGEDEFPAYDDTMLEVDAENWEAIIETVTEKINSGVWPAS